MLRLFINNRNELKLKWARMRLRNINHNKLFTLTAIIEIWMSYNPIDVYILSWNLNWNKLNYFKLLKYPI